jgi:hypothetical protein
MTSLLLASVVGADELPAPTVLMTPSRNPGALGSYISGNRRAPVGK